MPDSISNCGLFTAPPRQDDLGLGPGQVLGAPVQVPHADRAAALDHDGRGQRVGLHGQVRPVLGRVQVGVRRRPAPAVLLGDLVEADAVLVRAVEVRVGDRASVHRRFDECGVVADLNLGSTTDSGPDPPW